MQVDRSGILAGVFAGGALAVSSAPAHAILVYSGLQNISLTRPEAPGPNNLQSVELFTSQFAAFGWFQDVTNLNAGFSSTNLSFKFDAGSPYSVGQLPDNSAFSTSSTSLRGCAISDLSTCTGAAGWGQEAKFLAYRYNDNYGWARISVPDDFSNPNAVTTLVDWAYQTDPSVRVLMGEGIPAEEVPAPLPVMGAAAAFAASRRLRSRIQRQSKP